MPLERRNEPHMLRQFSKLYPSYNLNPLLRRRHQQLVEAQAFNQWLSDRRLRQEGETYADELGRMTEAVNRRIPQLRYAPAERAGVHRMARDVAAGRNTTSDSQVYGGPTVRLGLSRVRRRLVEERLRFSVVRAALFDPRTPAFWLSRLRFLALCAVLCRLSVRLQKSHSTPHGSPLHSTPLQGTPPPLHGTEYVSFPALFSGETDPGMPRQSET